jgi:hypothetical protein
MKLKTTPQYKPILPKLDSPELEDFILLLTIPLGMQVNLNFSI